MTQRLKMQFATLCIMVSALFAGGFSVHAQTVRLQTTLGDIDIELNADKAPVTVANFMAYVRAGFFTDIIFHRVIDGFMIQTGGYTANLAGKPTRPPITLESSRSSPSRTLVSTSLVPDAVGTFVEIAGHVAVWTFGCPAVPMAVVPLRLRMKRLCRRTRSARLFAMSVFPSRRTERSLLR